MDERLFTPGPVEVPPEALAAGSRRLIHHRTPEFRAELSRAFQGLGQVFRTPDPVLVLAASGTGAMEAAVVNLVSAGDEVVVVRGGRFADRWAELAGVCGARVVDVPVEWGASAEPAALRAALAAHPGAKVVFLTHSETSTGARHDVRALVEAVREAGALSVVDAITSVGAMELEAGAWGVDVAVGASQKGFMMPPGLAFVSVSPRAARAAEACSTPRFYLDFARALKAHGTGDTPFTPAISLVRSLLAMLDRMLAEGLPAVWARHARNGAAARAAVRAMGLEVFPHVPSEALTVARAPEGLASDALIAEVLRRRGLRLANGQGPLKGRVVRIGHLGAYGPPDILEVVDALEEALGALGRPVTRGAAAAAARTAFDGPPPPDPFPGS